MDYSLHTLFAIFIRYPILSCVLMSLPLCVGMALIETAENHAPSLAPHLTSSLLYAIISHCYLLYIVFKYSAWKLPRDWKYGNPELIPHSICFIAHFGKLFVELEDRFILKFPALFRIFWPLDDWLEDHSAWLDIIIWANIIYRAYQSSITADKRHLDLPRELKQTKARSADELSQEQAKTENIKRHWEHERRTNDELRKAIHEQETINGKLEHRLHKTESLLIHRDAELDKVRESAQTREFKVNEQAEKIASLTKLVNEVGSEINNLKKELENKDRSMNIKDFKIKRLESKETAKDAEIRALKKDFKAKRQQFPISQSSHSNKFGTGQSIDDTKKKHGASMSIGEQIEVKNDRLDKANNEITQLKVICGEKDREILRLKKQDKDKNETLRRSELSNGLLIAECRKKDIDIIAIKKRIENKRSKIDRKDAGIANLDAQVTSMDNQITQLQQGLQQKDKRILSLEASLNSCRASSSTSKEGNLNLCLSANTNAATGTPSFKVNHPEYPDTQTIEKGTANAKTSSYQSGLCFGGSSGTYEPNDAPIHDFRNVHCPEAQSFQTFMDVPNASLDQVNSYQGESFGTLEANVNIDPSLLGLDSPGNQTGNNSPDFNAFLAEIFDCSDDDGIEGTTQLEVGVDTEHPPFEDLVIQPANDVGSERHASLDPMYSNIEPSTSPQALIADTEQPKPASNSTNIQTTTTTAFNFNFSASQFPENPARHIDEIQPDNGADRSVKREREISIALGRALRAPKSRKSKAVSAVSWQKTGE